MTYRLNTDWRSKRNHQFGNMPPKYDPMHYSIASYCTDNPTENMNKKPDLDEFFSSEVNLNHLHMLPNPLQKNLADTLPKTGVVQTHLKMTTFEPHNQETSVINCPENAEKLKMPSNDSLYPSLSSIGNFISGVFSVISSAMPFQRRPKSPDYIYDPSDFQFDSAHEESPPLDFWLPAKVEPLNQNNGREQLNVPKCENNINAGLVVGEMMNVDCRAAVAQCEDKINKVRSLLANKTTDTPQQKNQLRPRRAKKVFVEPNSVEDHFEDAFTPEDFVKLSNDMYIEFIAPVHNTKSELLAVDGPITKAEMAPLQSLDNVKDVDTAKREVPLESTEIVKSLPDASADVQEQVNGLEADKAVEGNMCEVKTKIIQSCEDKVSRLKALLLERRKNNTKSCQYSTDSINELVPDEKFDDDQSKKPNKAISITKTHCRRHKNPNRLTDKRKKTQQRRNIQDDMTFAHEIDVESPSSAESSPRIDKSTRFASQTSTENLSSSLNGDCYFDEIAGRFHKSSTESEDPFQIVFADHPQLSPRTRKVSDCDSEDSFIVFQDSPDSCYTSADVFGDETSDIEGDEDSTDYESDGDSGHDTCKLAHSLSRTISDLTEDSLYEDNAVFPSSRPYSDSEDEVDCAVKVFDEVPSEKLEQTVCVKEDIPAVPRKPGLLLDDAKKLARKGQTPKKVRFSEAPPKVLVMRVWSYAARQARAGHWEKHAVDRERFKRRIADVDVAISWVLKPQHRARIKFQRFMPWWNQLRRKEIAEKKEREEQEKRRRAEEEERKRTEEEKRRIAEERRLFEELESLKTEEERIAEQEVSGVNIEVDISTDSACKEMECGVNEDKRVAVDNGNGSKGVTEIAEDFGTADKGYEEGEVTREGRTRIQTEERKVLPIGDQGTGDNDPKVLEGKVESRIANEIRIGAPENVAILENCVGKIEKINDLNANCTGFVVGT